MWHLQAAYGFGVACAPVCNGVEVTAARFNRRLGISTVVQRELILRRRTDRTCEEGRGGRRLNCILK